MGPKKHPLQTAADQAQMGVDLRRGVCECGAFIRPNATRCRRCQCRLAGARYRLGNKYKAKEARYTNTEKAKAVKARRNARRIWLGNVYRGTARTVELCAAIRAHVKERLREFIERQSAGKEAEGATPSAVSIEAKP